MTKRITKAEIDNEGKPLVFGSGVYKTALIPPGQVAEVIVRINGKQMSRDTWTASALTGCNAALQVRARVFDNCELGTLKFQGEMEPV